MARPTRTNAEWFMHPAAFRNDRRVKAIRARYGACGYGLLMMLIELLTDADNTALDTDDIELELLAGDLSATTEEVSSLIGAAEKVGLFARTEGGQLKCPQLDEWLAPVFEKRNRARNAAPAPKLSQPATGTGVSVTETTQSRVEDSREEKSTEQSSSLRSEDAASAAASTEVEYSSHGMTTPENSTPGSAHQGGAADVATSVVLKASKGGRPTEAEVLAYMTSMRPNNPLATLAQLAAKWHAHYTANGWKVGKNPMKDWQAACRTWLVEVPKLEVGQPLPNPQRHAYGNHTSATSAAARLHTPAPDASAGWGYPGG